MGVILDLINFINKQKPAVSAQNLNQMQTNIQTAITEIEENVKETYQEKLEAGDNIKIENGTISASGGGNEIIISEFSKDITQGGYSTGTTTLGTLEVPDGYSFIGFLSSKGATDFHVSYSLVGDTVTANYRNNKNGEVKTIIGCTALFIKNT